MLESEKATDRIDCILGLAGFLAVLMTVCVVVSAMIWPAAKGYSEVTGWISAAVLLFAGVIGIALAVVDDFVGIWFAGAEDKARELGNTILAFGGVLSYIGLLIVFAAGRWLGRIPVGSADSFLRFVVCGLLLIGAVLLVTLLYLEYILKSERM
ncbi:MAG: hypothetical protein EPN75_08775 [Beijerinckiaceae bacterium]|nr:MAG: hypothetical protein EPN75_08775 [Beijerinckiaceae bacterium]